MQDKIKMGLDISRRFKIETTVVDQCFDNQGQRRRKYDACNRGRSVPKLTLTDTFVDQSLPRDEDRHDEFRVVIT